MSRFTGARAPREAGGSGAPVEGTRTRRRLGAVLILVGASLASGRARADDADLQRMLQAARCVSPKVKLLEKRGSVSVFEATCANGAGEVITVTCGRSGCHREENEALDEERPG